MRGRRAAGIVPAIILASGLLFTGIGVALLLAVDAILGVIFIAVGVVDVLMGIFFRSGFGAAVREAEREAVERGEAAANPAADPSYNPYARED